MQVWNMLAENTGRKNAPKNRHLGTIAQLCSAISSQLRHISTIGNKLANFNGFQVLAALLHGTPVLGVSQTLRPSRWVSAHILVDFLLERTFCWQQQYGNAKAEFAKQRKRQKSFRANDFHGDIVSTSSGGLTPSERRFKQLAQH